jgi:signal peptidase II
LATVAALVLLADITSKLWVVESLGDRRIELLGDLLVIRQIRNPGAAFGIAQGATVVFTVVAVTVVAVIVRTAQQLRSAGWAAALGLLLGGATGNLVDRVFRSPAAFRGHVVDFIEVGWFPLFNVADSAIVCGGVLAVLLAVRGIEIDGSHLAARPATAAK